MLRRLVVAAGTIAAASLLLAGTAAAQRGVLTGTVVDAQGRTPLRGAMVTLVGSELSALTDSLGRFVIANVPAGDVELRIRRFEYVALSDRVRIAADDTTRAHYALIGPNDRELGQRARIEERISVIGDSMTVSFTVPERKRDTPPHIIVDGVVMGAEGPVVQAKPLIIIDGVIMFDAEASIRKIDPNVIESVEVVKGETAKVMYGPRGADGVISIRMKPAPVPPPPPPAPPVPPVPPEA